MPSVCASRSPSSSGARSCSATRVHRSSACCGSGPPTSRRARPSSPSFLASLHRARDAHCPRPRRISPGGDRSVGAVELKRAAVERRERAVAARETRARRARATGRGTRTRSSHRGRRSSRSSSFPASATDSSRSMQTPSHAWTRPSTSRGSGTPSHGSGDPRSRPTRAAVPTSYGAEDGLLGPRRQLVDRRSLPFTSSEVFHGLEPALGLRHEELRDRDVVLSEAAKPHLVELDEAPRAARNADREHEQGVHPEITQDERLCGIDSDIRRTTPVRSSPVASTSAVSGKSAIR